MNDKSVLLGHLKIDRNLESPGRGLGKWILAALGVAGLVVAVFFVLKPGTAVPIRVATAVTAAAASGSGSVLDASGYVIARRQAVVSAKITGKVTEVLVEEGMAVKLGQVLARLDDSTVRAQLAVVQSQREAAEAGLAVANARRAEAQRQLKRTQELHARKLMSDAALDAAQSSVETLTAEVERAQGEVNVAERNVALQRRNLDDSVIRAPFAGVVTVKNAQPGEMISPLSAGGAGTRTGIGTLVDMDSLEIEVDVNENFINRVRPGQPVEATLNAYPDWKIPCEVIAVIPAADRSKATVKVRIGLRVKDPRIIPDMGARVSFLPEDRSAADASEGSRGVFIPSQALAQEESVTVVFVLKDDTVERRAVTPGLRRGEQVQVLAGLSAGERVALGPLDQLADGVRVKIETESP
ncbi:MAG: efflux RND transporter periplasmic adaptor subunit [Nevskiales bacterium]|nr:efflux RND transporter periplasmic adaptor subunit [Nevskiales bacterium]